MVGKNVNPVKIPTMMVRNWTPFLLICLLLAGCMRDETTAVTTPVAPSPSALETPQAATGAMSLPNTATPSPAATALPSPTALPTPTPSPTPIAPTITAADQTVDETGELTIAQITSPVAGWLVARSVVEGSPADVLGYTAVPIGVSRNVTITIAPAAATETILVELYRDNGVPGALEIPDPDEPVYSGDEIVAVTMRITIEFAMPAIIVADQIVADDGVVYVDSVYTAVPGWLAVHSDEAGTTGALWGYVYLDAGLHENVPVSIPWREAPPYLLAVLYADNGRPQRFDYPDDDLSVRVNDEPVALPFHATFPPDIFVHDQPVVNGQIIIERVVSYGPGWVVVQYNDNGAPGLIIGFAPLVDGVNEQVVVQVVETAVTNPLHLMLHRDTGDIGRFNYPREDPQVTYNNFLMAPILMGTAPGNILYTADQTLPPAAEGETMTITVPLVIADINTWVVIHSNEDGKLGDILGKTWVAAGITHQIPVTLTAPIPTTLFAVLYHDADSDQEFDFPNGNDVPLQRNRSIIRAPFTIQIPPET